MALTFSHSLWAVPTSVLAGTDEENYDSHMVRLQSICEFYVGAVGGQMAHILFVDGTYDDVLTSEIVVREV